MILKTLIIPPCLLLEETPASETGVSWLPLASVDCPVLPLTAAASGPAWGTGPSPENVLQPLQTDALGRLLRLGASLPSCTPGKQCQLHSPLLARRPLPCVCSLVLNWHLPAIWCVQTFRLNFSSVSENLKPSQNHVKTRQSGFLHLASFLAV